MLVTTLLEEIMQLESLHTHRNNAKMYDVTATIDQRAEVFARNRRNRRAYRVHFAVVWAVIEASVSAGLRHLFCLAMEFGDY